MRLKLLVCLALLNFLVGYYVGFTTTRAFILEAEILVHSAVGGVAASVVWLTSYINYRLSRSMWSLWREQNNRYH